MTLRNLHRMPRARRAHASPAPVSRVPSFAQPDRDARPSSLEARQVCQQAHKKLAALVAEPAGEIRRGGLVIGKVVEPNRVTRSQGDALPQVGETQGPRRLVLQL